MYPEFQAAIRQHQNAFELQIADDAIEKLEAYYALVQHHNPLLHLVGPSSAEEFAVRHILESLTLLKHLPDGTKLADVGAGAGLPSIPCLIVRKDLKASLIESKEKKASFLNEALDALGLLDRATIVNRQFAEAEPGDCTAVTCRAIDRFVDILPRLLKWSGRRKLLLFGGPALAEALKKSRIHVVSELMPMSRERSLFVSGRSSV